MLWFGVCYLFCCVPSLHAGMAVADSKLTHALARGLRTLLSIPNPNALHRV